MLIIRRFLALMVLGLTLILSGCGGKQATTTGDKVVKVGFISSQTGDVNIVGDSAKNGFLMAIDQVGGQVGGYKIEYVVAAANNDVTEAANVVTKLITQDKVKAIVTAESSKTVLASSLVANNNKVPMISNSVSNPKLTVDNNKRKEFVFRTCFIDLFQGTVAAKFATETLKAKTAVILYNRDNDDMIGLANCFSDNFSKSGGQVLAMEAYNQSDVDFTVILDKTAKQKPDILYLPDDYKSVLEIGKQARQKGIYAIFMGGSAWDSKELNYTSIEGGYYTSNFSPEDPRPEVKKWVDNYQNKYGCVPDTFATLSYDSTNLLLNAIKTANSDDPAKIKDALQITKDYSVVTGKINFDKDGNPIKPASIIQIKGGKQTYVTTITP